MKILIAEDQVTSALYLRRTLERMGHEVVLAIDGLEAARLLEAGEISLVISDWVMPRMDGLELCRRIRARSFERYIYIILLTCMEGRERKLEGLRAGADDFLTKPPDPDELAVRLEIAGRLLAVHEMLHRQNALLAELATTDELTGVKNRRRFREDLEMFFDLSVRKEIPMSLILLDVDRFKQYNDRFGHPAGDDVLRRLSRTLRESMRERDVVARYGGEEFVVLLPATATDEAVVVAERLRSRIESTPWPLLEVTASFGVATTVPEITAAAALVEAADQALYQAKQSGRNRVVHHRLARAETATLSGTPPQNCRK
jgi:two-component system cell cycle response regulator